MSEQAEVGLNLFEYRMAIPIGDGAPVDFGDAVELAHGAGGEYFVGGIKFGERQSAFLSRDAVLLAEFQYSSPRDAGQAIVGVGGVYAAFANAKQVDVVGFGNVAIGVEHDASVCAGVVGFYFG